MTAAKKAPTRDRSGFYKLPDGTKCMSVTTINKHGVPKDLLGWAGYEVAKAAVESVPKLARLRGETARRSMVNWLSKAHERKRDAAADIGTAIHDAIEAHILGQPAPEVSAERQPWMDAFHRFLLDNEPGFEATEMVVANPADNWAGKADVWMTLPRSKYGPALVLGDWKSGSGAYPDAALQLSAYRRATVGWTKDGTEVVPPQVEHAVVVHLRPEKYHDTGYRIYPVDTSDATYAAFLSARDMALNWITTASKSAIGEALDIPMVAEEVA